MAKKKGGLGALIPVAISAMFLGGGIFWMIAGFVIGICSSFDPNVVKPLFWIIGGVILLLGILLFVVTKILNRKIVE